MEHDEVFDKQISDAVRNHPCLYNRRSRDYNDRNSTVNAWASVAKELGLRDGEIAQRMFVNLKKRFNKRKNCLKKAEWFGTSTSSFLSAKEKVEEYKFMAWLNPFIRPRSTKYFQPKKHEPAVASTTEHVFNKDGSYEVSECWQQEDSTDLNDVGIVSSVSGTAPPSIHERRGSTENPTLGKKKYCTRKPTRDEMESSVLPSVNTAIKAPAQDEHTDEEGLFGMLVASDLRKLSSFSKMIAKNKIQNVLFELQVQEHGQLQGPQQSAANASE